jgi:hypothetical protein
MGIRRIATACVLSMSMLCAGTALAAEQGGSKAAKADNPSKRVCRSVVVSGSRLATRTCRMQSAWDQDAERASKNVLDMQTNLYARDGAQTGSMSSGGPRR